MNNKYDVIILGAGPAGLECAKQLNNTSLSVLIIEKKKVIGPKVCAGGLTGLTNDFSIPKSKTRSFTKQKILILKKQYEITLVNPIKTIKRLDLGQHQLQQIKDSKNITVLTNTLINTVNEKEVITCDNKSFGLFGDSKITCNSLSMRN